MSSCAFSDAAHATTIQDEVIKRGGKQQSASFPQLTDHMALDVKRAEHDINFEEPQTDSPEQPTARVSWSVPHIRTGADRKPHQWITQRNQVILAFLCGACMVLGLSTMSDPSSHRHNTLFGSTMMDAPFTQPLCDHDHRCREVGPQPASTTHISLQLAFAPSPRTPFSTRHLAELLEWFEFQNTLAADARAHKGRVLFLGDSITESLRGTSYGKRCTRCRGIPEVLLKVFPELSPLPLAISGDQTQHLLWRLEHGELPRPLGTEVCQGDAGAQRVQVAVVLIGTNNLGAGHSPEEVYRGVTTVLELLRRRRPLMHVVMLGLFPRGDRDVRAQISMVNRKLRGHIAATADSGNGKVHYKDCGSMFVFGDGAVDRNLMPDLLHPNAVGVSMWMDCIKPLVTRLISNPS